MKHFYMYLNKKNSNHNPILFLVISILFSYNYVHRSMGSGDIDSNKNSILQYHYSNSHYSSMLHAYLYYICTYVPSPSLVVNFISLFGSSSSLHCFFNISIANNLSFIASRVFLATCKITNTQQYGSTYRLL